MITARQTSAARKLLGWNQRDLSAAIAQAGGKLSVPAIIAFERGGNMRKSNQALIRSTLENAGIQIMSSGDVAIGDGVAIGKNRP